VDFRRDVSVVGLFRGRELRFKRHGRLNLSTECSGPNSTCAFRVLLKPLSGSHLERNVKTRQRI
jgi:hypothetical protein